MSDRKFIRARVVATRSPARQLREIVLARPSRRFEYVAGQWLSFRVARGGDTGTWRVYSFASAPQETASSPDGRFRILVDTSLVGPGVDYFRSIAAGDTVLFHGPYGSFGLGRDGGPAAFVADGAGIGPIRALIIQHRSAGGVGRIHQVGVTRDRLAYRDELARLAETTPGWRHESLHPEEVGGLASGSTAGTWWYLCGSGAMLDALHRKLRASASGTRPHVLYERFGD